MSGFTAQGPSKSQRVHRRWPKVLFLIVMMLLLLLVAAVIMLRRVYDANLRPVNSATTTRRVTIAPGATTHDIAVILKKDGLIREAWAFEWYVRSNNLRDSLKAGTYDISPSQSVNDMVAQIVKGRVATNLVTILPAQRVDQIRKSFIDAGFMAADVDAALNPSLYKNEPALADKPAGASLEGYLYPDSFERTADTKPETIIRQSLALMQKHITPDIRGAFARRGLTVHEGVTLASIVEKEVGDPSDRPKVAQVFLKRLQMGMSLGSDVTAYYGAIMAGKEPSVDYDSPYNTRLHTGLPPGPISNVSENSLRAVAFPSATSYLYFVTGDDGVTHFSNTLTEHQAATRQYCKKLCSQ